MVTVPELQKVANSILTTVEDNTPTFSLPYKVYSALVDFYGVNGFPRVTVLQNTLGVNITWTKFVDVPGWYTINSPVNLFDEDKTMIFHSALQGFQVSYKSKQVFTIPTGQSTQIFLKNVNLTSSDLDPFEDLFGPDNMSVEIRVYE